MPLYDYECRSCGHEEEMITPVSGLPPCSKCGVTLHRLPSMINFSFGQAGAQGYYDENLETFITSNQHHKDVMREKGVTQK